MDTLRFITCGSVDDGKSTLIGRMLYEAKMIYADQEKALELESHITSDTDELDYALLLDGLLAEREQGITIDVAYRYFSTQLRHFIVADTPGHEEYTRNMAVGASFSDLAILLIDMTKGLSLQTKRHLRICELMGIQQYVFALNKMDLVNYSQERFEKVQQELLNLLKQFPSIRHYHFLPLSGKKGDNVLESSSNMPWYQGKALLPYLETVEIRKRDTSSAILPIQRVSRPSSEFRGFQGKLVTGQLCIGDEVRVLPGNMTATITNLYRTNEKVSKVHAGQPITVELNREIDISRGDVLTNGSAVGVSNAFFVRLLWTADEPLIVGQHYYLKLGTKLISTVITKIQHKIDVHSGEFLSVSQLDKNDIGECYLSTFEEIAFTKFNDVANMGRFILIDKVSNVTAACGIVQDSSSNINHIIYQETTMSRETRSIQKNQSPMTIWFTGLSGSGKSTLANALETYLMSYGKHTMILDGDNIRFGISKNLGFSEVDRLENIRRVAEISKLMNDAGLIVLTATISPKYEDRECARQIIGDDHFIEVYVSTHLQECERRDIKGLYQKARNGEITNFTGIQSPYDIPINPKVTIDTTDCSLEESLEELVQKLMPFLN